MCCVNLSKKKVYVSYNTHLSAMCMQYNSGTYYSTVRITIQYSNVHVPGGNVLIIH
jgi:hypothetical protein